MHQQGMSVQRWKLQMTQCAVQLSWTRHCVRCSCRCMHACTHMQPQQATFDLTFDVCDRLFHEVWWHLDACHLTQVQVAQCRRQPDRYLSPGGAGQVQEEVCLMQGCGAHNLFDSQEQQHEMQVAWKVGADRECHALTCGLPSTATCAPDALGVLLLLPGPPTTAGLRGGLNCCCCCCLWLPAASRTPAVSEAVGLRGASFTRNTTAAPTAVAKQQLESCLRASADLLALQNKRSQALSHHMHLDLPSWLPESAGPRCRCPRASTR